MTGWADRIASLGATSDLLALLADPDAVDAIADALRRVLEDAALADDLRARGIEQSARFTWSETARLTRESYRRALAG